MTTLIADSGGSKTDWRLLRQNKPTEKISSQGFNPYTTPKATLEKIIVETIVPYVGDSRLDRVYFYGAGITSKENEEVVRSVLASTFLESEVFVHSDLLGAARALCGDASGIVGILGTGSNCCFYHDGKTVCNTPALGWILGDEGSGTHLGKSLIRDIFYGNVPSSIAEAFRKTFRLSDKALLQQMYEDENPNAWFAGFVPFIVTHKRDAYCQRLVYKCFKHYIEVHVNTYREHASRGLYLVGSVAYYFSDMVARVAHDMNYDMKSLIQAPIESLVSYHQAR